MRAKAAGEGDVASGVESDVEKDQESGIGGARRIWRWCREHPFTVVVFVAGSTAGAWAAVAFELGPDGMATWKRALGGALAGAWLAMFPLGFRLFD